MGSYLLSKFNKDGSKLSSDTWMHIGDVGSEINGVCLTLDDYLAVEGWYLSFFEELISMFQVTEFVLLRHEDNRYLSYERNAGESEFVKISNPWVAYVAGDYYAINYFWDLIRLGLRRLVIFEADLGAIFVRNFDDMYFYIEIPENVNLSRLAKKHNLALVEFDKYVRQEPVFLNEL